MKTEMLRVKGKLEAMLIRILTNFRIRFRYSRAESVQSKYHIRASNHHGHAAEIANNKECWVEGLDKSKGWRGERPRRWVGVRNSSSKNVQRKEYGALANESSSDEAVLTKGVL